MKALLLTWVSMFLVAPAFGEDLDHERARAAWEAEQQDVAIAQDELDRAEARLQPIISRLNQAKVDLQAAKSNVQAQYNRLDQIDRKIANLEEYIDDLVDEIRRLQNQLDAEEVKLSRAQGRETNLLSEISDIDDRLQQVNRRIKRLEEKDPEAPELAQLRQRKQKLVSERSTKQNNLANVRQNIRRFSQGVSNLKTQIRRKQDDKRDAQRDLAQANRDRDRILLDIRAAENHRSDMEHALRLAQDAYDRELPSYNSAESNLIREQQEERNAAAYYNQVVENYRRARQAVVSAAQSKGFADSGREASERAPSAGKLAGGKDGTSVGSAKGTKDGKELWQVKGYRDGRAQGPALAQPYAQGISQGKALANRKATAEEYPKGYNDAYSARLKDVPVNEDSLDISVEVPATSGGNGLDLFGATKKSTPTAAPSLPIPSEPAAELPAVPSRPRVTSPNPNQNHFAYDCSNLVLPEFTPLCKDEYDRAYATGFDSKYVQLYTSAYQSEYQVNANSAYQSARNNKFQSEFSSGQTSGAIDAGILNGFAAELPSAVAKAYQAGKAQFAADLSKGYLLVVRSVALLETSGDGVLQPGEVAQLNIVVDNLGTEMSPKDHLSLKVSETTNGKDLKFNLRALPAIAPNTRMTLIGSTTVTSSGKFANDKVALVGDIVKASSEQVQMSYDASKETHFPLELTKIDIKGEARVNEQVEAELTFKNLSNAEITDGGVKVSTTPAVVEVESDDIDMSGLASNESKTVTVKLKPGVWVGANKPVEFVSKQLDEDGETIVAQSFAKLIDVKRNASIAIFDSRGRPLPAGGVSVRAGSTVTFYAQMVYHADRRLQGPFVLKYARSSDSGIRPGNGSTTSVNYGAYSPGWTPSRITMRFVVPTSLKGTSQWIMLQMNEGRSLLHAPQIVLNVQ